MWTIKETPGIKPPGWVRKEAYRGAPWSDYDNPIQISLYTAITTAIPISRRYSPRLRLEIDLGTAERRERFESLLTELISSFIIEEEDRL